MKDKIKEIRKSTGLSQSGFAQAMNIPTGTVRNWEQGLTKPPEWVIPLLEFYVAEKLQDKKESCKK